MLQLHHEISFSKPKLAKTFSSLLTLIAVISIGAAMIPRTAAAAAGIALEPVAPLYQGNDGCFKYWYYIQPSGPTHNYSYKITKNGKAYPYPQYGLFVGETAVVTETAVNANDYFVDANGKHVHSYSYTNHGPKSAPAICYDVAPTAKFYKSSLYPGQSMTYDVLADATDPDSTISQLKIDSYSNTVPENTLSIQLVTLPSGHKGIKVTVPANAGWAQTWVSYTISDQFNKQGSSYINVKNAQ